MRDDRDETGPGDLGAPGGDQEYRHFGRPPPDWPHIPGPGQPAAPGCAPGWPGGTPSASDSSAAGGTASAASKAALTIPWRTLADLCEEPGLLSRIGPVTAHAARDLAAAALIDPACIWKIIITSPSGQVVAVTRVRRPRAGTPGREETPGAPGLIRQVTLTIPLALALAGPAAWLEAGRLGGMLAAALRAARRAAGQAAGTPADGGGRCAHQGAVAGYRVPGRLRDFIDARDQGCRNPVCRQPAFKCDADHTFPWDKGGLTCSCDLSDECRRHHRLKQLRRWQLRQPRPGDLIWTTPAGLSYATMPPPHPA